MMSNNHTYSRSYQGHRERDAQRFLAMRAARVMQYRPPRSCTLEGAMVKSKIGAGLTAPGEYAPAGEAQGEQSTFSAEQIAAAFGVDLASVQRAMVAELGLGGEDRIDSRQAQQLAESLLPRLPLAEREAALMRLGAFTPRVDHDWGIGEAAPGEESDRVAPAADAE
jgi:hypothetical protein